jgi:signal transduction histidine kinase
MFIYARGLPREPGMRIRASVPPPPPPPAPAPPAGLREEKVLRSDNIVVSMVERGRGRILARGDAIGDLDGRWVLMAKHRAGSLEAAVAAIRMRNLMISSGVLMLLALAVGLIVVSTRRAQGLARQQMEFVAAVSHELRTPLASIRVFAELLRRGKAQSAETVQKYGEHIEAESRRLSRLIDNILDFSRIESGAKEYRFSAASLEDVVASVVDTFRIRTGDAGFRIALETPQPRLPPVEMDADAIGQVLHNLLDNAVKYSGDARDILVKVERDAERALCTVRDSGPGIPAAERERVFERFHRVGTGLVHDVKGSGLGLAIVRHVVGAHGGRVDVESGPGRGTAVRFGLPLNGGSGACRES